MESDSRIGQYLEKAKEWLGEQDWFQQLKAKWDELDPQSRFYLKIASVAGSACLVLIVIFSAMWNVHALKRDYREKMDLVAMLDSANDEIRSLRESLPPEPAPGGPDEKPDWKAYFTTVGTNAGVDVASLDVGAEKSGLPMDQAKEAMFDLKLKHVTIRQVVRYAYYLETGAKPVKLRNLTVDTKADPTGYMDAALAVSGFAIVASAATGGK